MRTVTLGSTGITVPKNAFGALPIQRIDKDAAAAILRKAYDEGVRFFDTARAYSDSEEKIGYALSDVRDEIYIASKTMAKNAEGFWKDLETTLTNLKTDHVDILQFHNPPFCPKPGDESGLYDAALEAKAQGKIRHIGITNHRINVAKEAIESGLYETLQFPFSYLATDEEKELPKLCKEKNMGFIAMKGLSGGLLTNAKACYAFMCEYDNVLPIWGVQRMEELEQFLACGKEEPELTEDLRHVIQVDRDMLSGSFCRGCGYCLPCPAGIEIPNAARMYLMVRRAPVEAYTTPEWKEKMKKIENCIGCNHCKNHCPYGLDTPNLLKENLEDYKRFF
ncbi:MAG: aldo/keto reductase [Firmicutes bacterium]|nr:aldo/keto reductase [Bacillota bacterium]